MAAKIYINPEDDINTIIDNVISHTQKDVNLVVPSGARILQNIVDAYLLKDAASANAKEVTITTNDVMGKIFAERAGMKVSSAQGQDGNFFVSESMAKMADIVPKKKGTRKPSTQAKKVNVRQAKAQASKVKPTKKDKKKETTKIPAVPRSSSRFLRAYEKDITKSNGFKDLKTIRQKNSFSSSGFNLSTPKIVIFVLVLAVLVAGFVFGRALPKADVTVFPVREAASFNVDIFVDQVVSDINLVSKTLPGQLMIRQEVLEKEFGAGGIEDVNKKAGGTITIFNEFSSKPQTFIPSRFESEDGKIFWTTRGVTVPGADIKDGQASPGTVEVEVLAAETGEAYNITSSRFTMPALKGTERFNTVYAVSNTPMTGGLTGQAVVVSSGDLEAAYGSLESSLSEKVGLLRTELSDELILWEETYNEEVASKTTTHEVGDPTDKFTAEVKMVARAVVFKEADLNALLDEEIQSRLSDDQAILPKSKDITFLSPPVVDYQKGTIGATLQVKVDVIDNLSTDSFQGAILNKNKSEIKQILVNFKGIERVEVKLWPIWVKKVPKNTDRVNVVVFGM